MPGKTPHTRVWGHHDWRADAVAGVGEFLGTFTFLLFGLGGIQAARAGSPDGSAAFLLMAATSMGIALAFSAWVFFRVTGAAFNPNIALALLLVGVISPIRFVFYAVAQILGAIAAAGVLEGLLPGPLEVNCEPSAGVGTAQALFLEIFLTFGLVMTVLMVAVEKNRSTPFAPLAIGLALFSTQLAGIQFTGAAVNTARAFGSAVASKSFVGSHWIYWLGPTLGAVLAAALHRVLHLVHYWELNPGADAITNAEAEKKAQAPASSIQSPV